MSQDTEVNREGAEVQPGVRLRVPERRQMAMVVQCPDDLVPAQHAVRMVMALVETLDLSRFSEPIKAGEGVAGRDATDPRLLVGLWLYACIRGIGSARELARRCEESAAFRWLCGGVTVNHRLLSDFRGDHAAALDELFTQVIASLVDKELVSVSRVSQDGVRVRVSAGASSFRREERGQKIRDKEPRVSSSDAEARVLKMPNGGFNPAWNVQLATDTKSRAIVGVEVNHEGSDSAGLSQPMREQVEQRSGCAVKQHLLDGGYLRIQDIEYAHERGVELFVPPKPARTLLRQGRELEPKPGDSEAVLAWKRRMASAEGKEIYRQRAATSETVNADLRSYRGLTQFTVRGLAKAKCVALWCALAYNVMHFGAALLT